MKKAILILIYTFISNVVFGQIANIIPTSSSIAHTSVSDIRNWSGFNNPAMLGYIEQSEIGIHYENRYLLSELSTKSVQLGISTNAINAGLSYSYFGYSLYHEMMVGLGFARNFSDKFAMGVQFNYYTAFFTASNSYRGALLPQLGLSVRLSPTFSIGFHSFNPFQTNINTEYVLKRIPSVFSLGTEYNFAPELVWRTQVDKEMSSNYRFATGFEYQMLERLSIKLGAYGSDYLVPCLGFGFNSGSFLLDFNCELHPLLGLNTMAAVKYKFNSR
ncbi:MAG: hypothetical protein GZ091_02615 [Paludibacter sp.]|nr:hypothetical protein [Paludibacter sp.]